MTNIYKKSSTCVQGKFIVLFCDDTVNFYFIYPYLIKKIFVHNSFFILDLFV